MGSGPLGGGLSSEYEKSGHVENYGGQEITVGRLYVDFQNMSGPIYCVEVASPELVVLDCSDGNRRQGEGRGGAGELACRLKSICSDLARERGERLKKEGNWLVLRANSSDRI